MTGKRGGAAVQITQHFGSMESAVDKMSAISFSVEDAVDVIAEDSGFERDS